MVCSDVVGFGSLVPNPRLKCDSSSSSSEDEPMHDIVAEQ